MAKKIKHKTISFAVRVTEEENRAINYLISITQKNRTEVLLDAVALMILSVSKAQKTTPKEVSSVPELEPTH